MIRIDARGEQGAAGPSTAKRSDNSTNESAQRALWGNSNQSKEVKIPAGFEIGWNRELDHARALTITPDGFTVVAKGEELERFA